MKWNNFLVIIVVCLFTLPLISCNENRYKAMNKEQAIKILNDAVLDSADLRHQAEMLIDNEETAIAVAEIFLFRVYGKDKIMNERPYEICLVKNYWIIEGTLPEGYDGGTFQIVLNSLDGQVLRLIHFR